MSKRTQIAAILLPLLGALLAVPHVAILAGPVSGRLHFRAETGHYYVWIEERMKWEAANEFAHKYSKKIDGKVCDQWHLATITDAAENAFVFEVVLNPGKRNTEGGQSFLGAIVTDGSLRNFKWVTGEPFNYSNFAPGQPDLARENVIEMGGMWGRQWNNEDGPGSPIEEKRPFILEHEPDCLHTSVTITTFPDVSVPK